jgi:hypothetical protein
LISRSASAGSRRCERAFAGRTRTPITTFCWARRW